MRLTVIGCSGSHPSPDAACSAYLLEHGGFRLLIDLGNGALGALQKHVDPRDIDAIFISHLHGDHWLDLVPLAHVRRHHPDGRVPAPIPLITPAAERPRIAGAFGRPQSDLEDVFVFQDPGNCEIGPFEVSVLRTRHPVETYAIKLAVAGKTFVYTADTGPFAELGRFANGADLLLAEAGFVDGGVNPPDTHLTATDAGELAKQADAVRLVVTHVAPWYDASAQRDLAATAFGGETVLARPGVALDV